MVAQFVKRLICGVCVCDQELVSKITRITHTHRSGVNGALLQCAAIQTALTNEKPPPQLINHWTGTFLDKLLHRMQKHEGQLDGFSTYVI